MKKVLAVTMVFLCVGLAFSAGQKQGKAEKNGKILIGMLSANLAEPWNVQMDEDVKTAAKEYPNVTVQFKDAQNDPLRQRAQLEEFVAIGVDAILISPIESIPLTEPVAQAMDAGIPVFVIGRKLEGEKFVQYVGTDDWALGYAAGQWVVEKFGGKKPNVVHLQGLMTSSPGYERHEGFMKAIKGSDVNVVYTADARWLEERGRAEMESALARFKKIDVVYGANDPAAHGAYVAAKAEGREKEMVFFGIDGLAHEGRAYVRDGIFEMTIYDATGGDIALHNAMRYLKEEKLEKTILKDAVIFEKKNLDTGGRIVKLPQGITR